MNVGRRCGTEDCKSSLFLEGCRLEESQASCFFLGRKNFIRAEGLSVLGVSFSLLHFYGDCLRYSSIITMLDSVSSLLCFVNLFFNISVVS